MNTIVPFHKAPTRFEAEEIIRKWEKEGKISSSKHCKERMKEREITIQQVMTCLAKGKVTEDPFFAQERGGGYETTVERIVAGDHLRIGVCLKLSQRLLVITAIKLGEKR